MRFNHTIYSYVERKEGNDYIVLLVYGYSAKSLKRPAIDSLMRDIKLENITKGCVYRIDRLTRSVKDMLYLTYSFSEYNVHFVSLYEIFDTITALGRLLVGVAIQMVQWERETISERQSLEWNNQLQKENMQLVDSYLLDMVKIRTINYI